MKILLPILELQDYGGIAHHVEILARAYREMGHEVTAVKLMNTTRAPHINKAKCDRVGASPSIVANEVQTISGWYGIKVFGYGDKTTRNIWRKFTDTFDVLIHQVPIPELDADGAWKKLYAINTPQVMTVPDAHCRDRYPHLLDICDRFVGAGTTHEAGYIALSAFPIRRAYIGTPHVPLNWREQRTWKERKPRFVSAHVWKSVKNMDLLVRAFPYMSGVQNILAGDGIEGRYMRSVDKCKPKYEGIWKRGVKHGMNWTNILPPKTLRNRYLNSRVMVDLAYNEKYASYGNSHNRALIEGYNAGCVPVVFEEAMTERTNARLFQNGVTHVGIPRASTPKEIAEAITDTIHMEPMRAKLMVNAGRELIRRHFDYRIVAQAFLDIWQSTDHDVGVLGHMRRGHTSEEVQTARDHYIERFHAKQRTRA
jgi:glycosyltransferase involved in cell wall biosynthesis